MPSPESFLSQLLAAPPPGCAVHSSLVLPARDDEHRPLPSHFPAWLCACLRDQGITHLTPWQYQALDMLQHGNHVHVMAPAGSGRGLVRLLAMYQALSRDRHGHGLCIFPQKHREYTQLGALHTWQAHLPPEHYLTAAIYDGDTPTTQRRMIKRDIPHVIMTTPEMLHTGILAYHSGWRSLFQRLRYVVLVDVQTCTGALATHLGHVLRRLQRIAGHYGAQPQYLLTSAPLANAAEVAYALTGHTCSIVTGTARQQQAQRRVILTTDGDPATTGRELLARYHEARLPTLFLARQPSALTSDTPALTPSAEAYNDAELQLLQSEKSVIVLPHDLDPTAIRPRAVRHLVFLGLPPSLTHLHTYLALLAHGRSPSTSLLVIEGTTPLEWYLLRYPEVYHSHWLQGLPTAFGNHASVQQHLLCAAAELALSAGEPYAGLPNLDSFIQRLAASHDLDFRPAARQWTSAKRQPHRQVRLRRYERPVALINRQDGHYLTSLLPDRAFRHCFVGGYYTHDDHRIFQVEQIDEERQRIFMRPSRPTHAARGHFRTRVEEKRLTGMVMAPTYHLAFGTLDYTTSQHAVEYLDTERKTRRSLEMVRGRTRSIHTQGAWLRITDAENIALHTLLHAVLTALPLLCIANPASIRGGVYTHESAGHVQHDVVFTDTDLGGNGISAFVYRTHTHVLRTALQVLLQCDCLHGCERCVALLQCDTCTGQETLDRQAGITLLQRILGEMQPLLETVQLGPNGTSSPSVRRLYLCLTTQKSAEEVGGWQHKHLLGLGLAMTYDCRARRYTAYTAETVEHLVTNLRHADEIIGFNLRDFDYQVLQPYTDVPLPTLPSCAMLDDIQHALGYRVSRRHLVHETLGIDWPDDSLATLRWYRDGDMQQLIQTCRRDIDLLRALARHGSATGTVMYRDRTGTLQTVPVPWQCDEDDA